METWKLKDTALHVIWPRIPENHLNSVYVVATVTGMAMNVTSRSAAAMLTNRKPVKVLISGLLATMKMSSRFPVIAINIVMEYSTVICSGLGSELGISVEGIIDCN